MMNQLSGSDLPLDRLGRPLRDLRVSVTDRCNFRCSYCMPREVFGSDFEFLKRAEILSYEEIARVVAATVPLGVRKVRITGGEPLLRSDLPRLIELLATVPGLDLALTTNGSLLPNMASSLAAAGLDRITVSLDSLDDATFRRMNDADVSVQEVLEGIEAAASAGLDPIKINAVIVRGVNEDGYLELAEHFRGSGHIVRFIEYMDVGTTNGWNLTEVVPARELLEGIRRRVEIEPLSESYPGEVAKRWRYADGSGEIGFITSVSSAFCGACTRARLSAEGKLYTCLFAQQGTDLKSVLRAGADDAELGALIASVWSTREDRYSEIRSEQTADLERVEMSYIGG